MKTKVSLLVALSILLITPTLFAQSTNDRARMRNMSVEDRANHETTKMKRQLSLTSEQEARVKAINLRYAQQRAKEVEKLKAQGKTRNSALLDSEHENMRNIFRQLHEDKKRELQAVLNTSQYNMYTQEQTRAEKKARRNQARTLIDFEF